MAEDLSEVSLVSSPISYTTAPDITLTRIGRNKECFQWKRESHQLFLLWWNETPWVLEQPTMTCADLVKQMAWNSSQRISDSWRQYDQAARCISGEPVVVCRRCQGILAHPNAKRIGTSSLSKHLASTQCQRSSSQGSQESIRQFTHVSYRLLERLL